jgi:hypothetical protein
MLLNNEELAFAFSAGEFLDEELECIEEKFGKIDFITKGRIVKIEKTKETPHNYQYWCAKDAIDELNALLHKDDIKIEIVLQSKEEIKLLKDIFNHTTPNELNYLLKSRKNHPKDVNTILIMELCHNVCNSIKKIE